MKSKGKFKYLLGQVVDYNTGRVNYEHNSIIVKATVIGLLEKSGEPYIQLKLDKNDNVIDDDVIDDDVMDDDVMDDDFELEVSEKIEGEPDEFDEEVNAANC